MDTTGNVALSRSPAFSPNEKDAVQPMAPDVAAALLKAQSPQPERNQVQPSVRAKVQTLIQNIEKVIVGKTDTVKFVLVGLLARGHILIEDVPGVGKTTLARALAKSIDCEFRRIQFTPDLLPSDVVGVSVFDQKESRFKFHQGPLFANVVLADEINRTAPRTQSALLEAMNDFQVSVDGVTHALPGPFIVLATENPIEYAGTYPLPEAQLDRFMLRVSLGYPDRDSEREMLKRNRGSHPLEKLESVIHAREVQELQQIVRGVALQDSLLDYILEIATKTRDAKGFALGVSPRGCEMLRDAARAYAVLEGREYVLPDDIKKLAPAVLGHRVISRNRDIGGGRKEADTLLAEIIDEVPVPI
jgi:MoxR-like ATPase